MSCGAVRGWLHVDTESLSEAERLVLEDHLSGCESCRADRKLMVRVREVGAALPDASIGPRGHNRALAQARMQGRRTDARVTRPAVHWLAAIGIGATLATAAVVTVVVVRSDGAASPAPATDLASAPSEDLSPAPKVERQNLAPSPTVSAPAVAVVEGTLTHGDTVIPLNTEIPVDVPLRANSVVRLVSVSMTVVVATSSEIRRPTVERELWLHRGSADVTGDGSRIVTDAFSVEVRGEAAITTKRVTVRKGTARVFAPDGRVLASVAAPTSWQLADAPIGVKANAAELLEQARKAFNTRDFAAAERHADAALDATPTRAQTAEARTLLAECAQATGKLDDALARYEAIATRFADLPAGETALFAAARLQATRDRDAARELFERYLERYPSGRFVEDARRQLRAR
jgi:TolA-binding protein